MASLVAIDIKGNTATVVSAHSTDSSIEIVNVETVTVENVLQALDDANPVSSIEENKEKPQQDQESAEIEELAKKEAEDKITKQNEAIASILLEADETLATVHSHHVIYENLALPFKDPKKLEQVVPIQLQDLLPFELDRFLLDTTVLGTRNDGEYRILTSLIPEEQISSALKITKQIGANPKVISSRASAVSHLAKVYPDQLKGSYAMLSFFKDTVALVVFIDNVLCLLRDIPLAKEDSLPYSDIFASLLKVERDTSTTIEKLVIIGSQSHRDHLASLFPIPVELLTQEGFLTGDYPEGFTQENLSWALGLFAHEVKRNKQSNSELVDFRTGAYIYKPGWGTLTQALKDELLFISLAVVLGIAYLGIQLYTNFSHRAALDNAITERIQSIAPNESVSYMREVDYFQTKNQDLEEQLRAVGSLSSLSPLDSLKEISETIPESVDVSIEKINIGYTTLSFSGSVLDIPAVGRLNSALEQKKGEFCEVKVNTKEKIPNSSRMKFTVDITLCE